MSAELTAAAPHVGERIEPADASSALFVGFAPAGPVGEPVLVESLRQFADTFGTGAGGPFIDNAALAHAVRGFFRNGGSACRVLRLAGAPGAGSCGAARARRP